jgi:hypothetical protein
MLLKSLGYGLLILALFFLWFAVEAGWLGSTPGYSKEKASIWFLVNIAAALTSFVGGYFLVKRGRKKKNDSEK